MEKLSVNGIDLAYEARGDGPPLPTAILSTRSSSSSISTAPSRTPRLYVIPNGGHDAIFRAARPDFARTALAFLGG